MPRFMSGQRRSLTTDVTISENSSSTCIQHTGDATCAAIYGLSRFEARTGFTANLAHAIRTNVNFTYIHNDVTTLRQVSSTITLSAFVNIPLTSLGM